MKYRYLTVLGGMLMSGLASAAMIEVTLDVTINQRLVMSTPDAGEYVSDSNFTPHTFTITARFDPEISQPGYDYSSSGYSGVTTNFPAWTISASPFTQAFRNKVPEVSTSGSVYSQREALNQDGSVSTTDYLMLSNSGGNYENNGMLIYEQYVSLLLSQGAGSFDERFPPVGNELLGLLQGLTGQTYAEQYVESYTRLLTEPFYDENGFVLGYQPIFLESERLLGDVTVRSVQVVPLPAVGLWMQLASCAVVAAVARRRRAMH